MKIILGMFAFFVLIFLSWSKPLTGTIGKGAQPQLTKDVNGVIRITFGRNDSIFCATSTDQGKSFTTSTLVARVAGMHLGMTRGPQIASSVNWSMIAAMDKKGNIHCFLLNHLIGKWVEQAYVND